VRPDNMDAFHRERLREFGSFENELLLQNHAVLKDFGALAPEGADPDDLITNISEVEYSRASRVQLPALNALHLWCTICGVQPTSQWIAPSEEAPEPEDHTQLWKYFTQAYRILLWCALGYVSLVDCFIAKEQTSGAWAQVAIVLSVSLACAASFVLARRILEADVLNSRIVQAIRNSSDPERTIGQISASIYVSLAFAVLVAAAGAAADFLDSSSYANDPTSPIFLRLNTGGIFFYRLGSILVQLQVSVGICLFAVLVRVLRLKASSTYELLTTYEDQTSVARALKRFIDIDICVSHASHKYSFQILIIFLGFFLKFLLCALYHVTENVKEKFVSRTQFGPAQILDMLVQPGMVCVFGLVILGQLNQEIDDLIHATARFALRQRSKPKHDRKLIKEFQTYVKYGVFYFRIYGFVCYLSTASKFVAVAFSTYILLLRFKRWGIL